MNKNLAMVLAAGALVVGAAAASYAIPGIVAAADPAASPEASPSTIDSSGSSTDATAADPSPPADTAVDCPAGMPGGGRHFGPGGLDADDLTAAAGALNMSEADLTAALEDGQTVADVADAQGVPVQDVIDAIVASDKAEIQADLDAGNITQTQADNRLSNLNDHVTAEVNGVRPDGFGGPGGPGGRGHHGSPWDDSTTDSTSTDSTTSTTS